MSPQTDYRSSPPHAAGTHDQAANAYGREDGSELARKSIVWGLISIPFNFVVFPPVMAIVLGVKARRLSKATTGRANGMATAGMVLGIATFGPFIVQWAIIASLVWTPARVDSTEDGLVKAQLKQCSQWIDHYHGEHGHYPRGLKELGKSEEQVTDPWGRPFLYALTKSGFMLGTRGKSLEDSGDDFHWLSALDDIVIGPLPKELKE